MAIKIRLKRLGTKKRPCYRIVVADSRMPRDGRDIEQIGFYNPMCEPEELKIKEDRAKLWIDRGAKCTDRVCHLFVREGLLDKAALPVRPSKPPKVKEVSESVATATAAPAEEQTEAQAS